MTSESPKIDFVIPAYNAQGTITRTLESLQKQTDSRWRAIVVDDGSNDATVEAVVAIGDGRVSLRRQDNAGPSAARNFGFGHGRAPLVCFLDSDDTIHEPFVELMVPIASEHSIGASCGYDYRSAEGDQLHRVPAMGVSRWTRSAMLALDPPAIMSMVYKRSVLDQLVSMGDLFNPKLRAFEDWDMLYRLCEAHGLQANAFGRCEHVLASYWCTPGSLCSSMATLWEQGRGLILSWSESQKVVKSRLRGWGLGMLAGCLVVDDQATARKILDQLGPVGMGDAPVIGHAIRWHTMRQHGVGLDTVLGMDHILETRCRATLADDGLVDQISATMGNSGADRICTLLKSAKARAGQHGRVVIYGLGRNGIAFVEQADRLGIGVVLMDDHGEQSGESHRWIEPGSLTVDDVVIVTPMDAGAMVTSLGHLEPGRVLVYQSSEPAEPSSV
tara:strand:- start:246869 stop:248200 length:1332 start_codon:yes stop_codon:yes gene_type:complete